MLERVKLSNLNSAIMRMKVKFRVQTEKNMSQ